MAARKKKSTRKAVKKTAARAKKPAPKKRKVPESLRLRGISPGFTVADIAKSIDWYTRVLGFTMGEKWEDNGQLMGAEMHAGSTRLWLGQDDWKKGRGRSYGVGVRLYCNTAQDIDQLAKDIKARGGMLDHEPTTQSWGTRDFGITDPDGYKITIQNM